MSNTIKKAKCRRSSSEIADHVVSKIRKQELKTAQADIPVPQMLDPETEAAIARRNIEMYRQAGGLLGSGVGVAGGAGTGALLGRSLGASRLGRYGTLAAMAAGGLGGGLLGGGVAGPMYGRAMSQKITAQDLENLNRAAYYQAIAAGFDPQLAALELLKFRGQAGPEGQYQLTPYYDL